MLFRPAITLAFLLTILSTSFVQDAAASLTTDELIRLKASGVSEDIIRLMVESAYADVGRVIKLKEAGFKDETILSIIKGDLKEGKAPPVQMTQKVPPEPIAQPEKIPDQPMLIQTSARVKIERYLVYGDPILQNSQEINNATVSLLAGGRLKFEWPQRTTLDLVDLFEMKPFSSPFFWDLAPDDDFARAKGKNNAYVLTSGHSHKGRPTTDNAHSWVVSFAPANAEIANLIDQARSAK